MDMRPATADGAAADVPDRQLNKYLSISLKKERYAVPVLAIKEIIEYPEITPVPMMPGFIRGAINLRGRGVPVVDLAQRIGRGATQAGRRSCIVIVESPPERAADFDVGLLVDAVNEVVDIGAEEIEAAPSFGGQIRTDFIHGMGKVKGRFIVLLDVQRLLTLEDLERLSEAASVRTDDLD